MQEDTIIIRMPDDIQLLNWLDPTDEFRKKTLKKDFFYELPKSWLDLLRISNELFFYFNKEPTQ